MSDDLAQAIIASANRLKVNPVDLATAVSYETAGTFDPWKKGPTTQWGQHRGLIQWGEPQRQKYGVVQGMSNADQLKAAERYLTDAGVQPGMGLMDIYSAINAGKVRRYNASDANNGGAPGTVADKVNNQMAQHRLKAQQLLGGQFTAPAASQDNSLASMFTPPAGVNPAAQTDPLAAQLPTMPADNSFGSLAGMFVTQQANKAKQREEEQKAEAIRKAALFAPPGGVAGLYG